MAYSRYDPRRESRDPRPRLDDRDEQSRAYGRERDDDRSERGFFERAGDEIASWFGDDEADRQRGTDDRGYAPRSQPVGYGPPQRFAGDQDQGRFERSPRYRDEGYRRPYTGRSMSRQPDDRASFSGMAPTAMPAHDRHYGEWRQRQIEALDRDYDEYRREHQSKFESDFSKWRTSREGKRQMLGQVREHMPVVGSDEEPVGTVDKVIGDRILLTRTDSSDGKHHAFGCTMIDRIDGDRVILSSKAEEAKAQLLDQSRDRALFERDDQGSEGPRILDRSFSGTY